MKKPKSARKNYATPGKPMTKKEFLSFIKEAEEGPFMTEKEFRKKLNAAIHKINKNALDSLSK